MRADRPLQQRINAKILPRRTGWRGRHIREPHRPMPPQRGDPRIRRRRHHGAQHAVGNFAAVFPHEQIGRDRLRPPAQPGDALGRAVGQPDQDRRHTGEVDQIGLQHPQRDPRRHTGVNRVAARLQNGKPGRGRQIMARPKSRAVCHRRSDGVSCAVSSTEPAITQPAAKPANGPERDRRLTGQGAVYHMPPLAPVAMTIGTKRRRKET